MAWLSDNGTKRMMVIALCHWSTPRRWEAIQSGHIQHQSTCPAFISTQNVICGCKKSRWTAVTFARWTVVIELANVCSQMPQLQPNFSKASCAGKTIYLFVVVLYIFVACPLCYLTLHIESHRDLIWRGPAASAYSWWQWLKHGPDWTIGLHIHNALYRPWSVF